MRLVDFTIDDSEKIRHTRNAVREWLFNTEEITHDQQVNWFLNVYSRNSEIVYLFYDKKIYRGFCKFDPKTGIIAIMVEPEYQRLSYGYKFLGLVLKRLKKHKIIAEIKIKNIPSLNLFIKAGFRIDRIENDIVYMSKKN